MAVRVRPRPAVAAGVLVAVLTTGCAEPDGSRSQPSSAAPSAPASSAPDAGARRIAITLDGVALTATLRDVPAAADLRRALPLTVTMRDHGGVEKTGRLPVPLSSAGVPAADDPVPGDLGYYAPGQDLVLYYGDQGSYPGIVRLGTLEGDVEALRGLDGDLRVTVEPLP